MPIQKAAVGEMLAHGKLAKFTPIKMSVFGEKKYGRAIPPHIDIPNSLREL
jgi:hypothetical protein